MDAAAACSKGPLPLHVSQKSRRFRNSPRLGRSRWVIYDINKKGGTSSFLVDCVWLRLVTFVHIFHWSCEVERFACWNFHSKLQCFGSRRLRIYRMMPCRNSELFNSTIAIPQCQAAQFACLTLSQDPIFQDADLTMTWFARLIYFQPCNKFDELFCHGGGRARFERKAAVKQKRTCDSLGVS